MSVHLPLLITLCEWDYMVLLCLTSFMWHNSLNLTMYQPVSVAVLHMAEFYSIV